MVFWDTTLFSFIAMYRS